MTSQPPLVAVIDDEVTVLAAMKMLLETLKYRVIAGESGDEVLARLADQHQVPDLILADFRLRAGHTGIEAIDTIRSAADRMVPGILITGDTSDSWLDQARARRLAVLQKPVLPTRLAATLEQALRTTLA